MPVCPRPQLSLLIPDAGTDLLPKCVLVRLFFLEWRNIFFPHITFKDKKMKDSLRSYILPLAPSPRARFRIPEGSYPGLS